MALIATKGGPSISLVAQNATGWPRTSENTVDDASFITLATVTLPGGLMGLHSKLLIVTEWDYSGSGTTKTAAIDIGGQNIGGPALTTSRAFNWMTQFQNLGSLSIQKTSNGSQYGATNNVRIDTTVNTAINRNIDMKFKWSAAAPTETVTLISYSIWHYPGA